MEILMRLSNVISLLNLMDLNNSKTVTIPALFEETKKLLEDLNRHEKFLEKFISLYQQQEELPILSAWLPGEKSAGPAHKDVSLRAIRLIKKKNDKSNDSLTQLKATWFGKFYIHHLKNFNILRLIVILLWRYTYPIYINQLASPFWGNKEEKRWRPLFTLREFSRDKSLKTLRIANTSSVRTPRPEIFPEKNKEYLISPHESYNFPELYVSTIKNGMVYGETNLALVEDGVICHDLYDFARDFTSEELHGRTLIDPKRQRIRWLLHDKEPENIAIGATFVDACAANYAHWLTEVLPRVAAFCNDSTFAGIPLIINEGLHKNIMESLALVVEPDREIIALATGRALIAETLVITSVTGYVPFERRNSKFSEYNHGLFSPGAFTQVREKINNAIAGISTAGFPKRIYLRRNSGGRKVINGAEIERYLHSIGFAIVEPEILNFSQQAALFKNAQIIIGASGAALANLIFAPNDARIIILIPQFKDTNYWYWQNIACATGKKITYVLSHSLENGIHSDFSVELKDLSMAIIQ